MLETLIITAAVAWSADCEDVGNMYWRVAMIRDQKVTLGKALEEAKDNRIRKALVHVYDRWDLSPSDWKYFAIGVCHGSEPGEPKDRGFTLAFHHG